MNPTFSTAKPSRWVPATFPLALAIQLLVIAVCVGPSQAQRVPPDEPWRTFETEHFRVTFPEHLEDLARRVAMQAEWAHARLSEQFVRGTPWANRSGRHRSHRRLQRLRDPISFEPHRPIRRGLRLTSSLLGNFDDWLELLIVHELTHIFHLDRTGPLQPPLAFRTDPVHPCSASPTATMPRWVIEGIGTWYESALTGKGRVLGTYHDMVLRTAALEGRFESIGQAGGWSPQWPGGTRVYAYGSLFFEHLMRKYGRDRMAAFVQAVEGQWIPYRLDAAGRNAFGVSLSTRVDDLGERLANGFGQRGSIPASPDSARFPNPKR